MAFQIGDCVGDYEVVGVLGHGGMGQVYKVRHRILDRLDAMKVLLPGREDDPQLHQRFEREIRVQASLHHTNIAALHTALWIDNRLLMIIEFVDGMTLDQKLRGGPVSIEFGVDCISAVLDALNYAHAMGVTHRDVKPANIMITADGTVKLTDFGIARTTGETITRQGMAVGSLYYMSPEQIKGGVIDGRSDIYSAGVTLYEALLGVRPIRGEGEHAIILAHLEQTPVAPVEAMPGFPETLSQAIMKSLAKAPEDRFQTAGEFRAALAACRGAPASPILNRSQPPAGGIDSETLTRMEKCLTAAVGPIAKALAARAARGTGDPAALRLALAEQIPEEPARQKFLKCCERGPGQTTGRQSTAGASLTSFQTKPGTAREWTPEFLEEAERGLARHIGPLARTIVSKASRKVQTPTQFIEMLSSEIPDARKREEFASQLRRRLG